MRRYHNHTEGQGAPEGDRTDPLVNPGQAVERVDTLKLYPGAILERIELYGAEGLSSSFLRVSVSEPGPLPTLLATLLPNLPEAASGLRDLLILDGASFAAALEEPAATLHDLAAGTSSEPALRTRDVIEMLGSLGAVLAVAAAQGFVWPEPDPRLIGFHHPPLDGIPATRLERGAVLLDWAGLAPGDEQAAAGALARLALDVLSGLADGCRDRLPGYLNGGIERLLRELESIAGTPGLTYAKLTSAAAHLSPRVELYAATDTGRRRNANEDAFLTMDLHQRSLTGAHFIIAAVADGMGGHASGEVASSLCLDLLRQQLALGLLRPRTRPLQPEELAARISEAVPMIAGAIQSRAQMEPELEGMGTTLCGLALLSADNTQSKTGPAASALFNVGDSRAYLFNGGGLSRLSLDHSHVQDLVDAGEITPEEAFNHPYKNVITRCLGGGGGTAAYADVVPFDPGPGEMVLICSDGLSDALRDSEIEAVITSSGGVTPPESLLAALARALIYAANEAGGPDNITVVLMACV